ncbi:MAG: site-specific DNA-methyltransferase [Candidatus Competibacteraceae bacterium]|nr:site-specific DNA-methyltransferase [Candidatus Competibacteraceae bacterium]
MRVEKIESHTICKGDSLQAYGTWKKPNVIVSDGPYGISGYDGDADTTDELTEMYEPHIQAWTKHSVSSTTLWFWNTELGWAEVHPVLKKNGWLYRACNVWDKGISHCAGNTNTKTLRKFPVVTEVCVHYVRKPEFKLAGDDKLISAQGWLRSEWDRTGLPYSEANAACEVKNAATRKYLTSDHLWYFPPSPVFVKLVEYANLNGKPEGKPYFSFDGKDVVNGPQWECIRAKFKCKAGVTNVWQEPAVRGSERVKIDKKAIHPNQKPLRLMDRIIRASSDEGDVIWEPFGGLCSASIAARRLKREAYSAEINSETYEYALKRSKDDIAGDIFYDES